MIESGSGSIGSMLRNSSLDFIAPLMYRGRKRRNGAFTVRWIEATTRKTSPHPSQTRRLSISYLICAHRPIFTRCVSLLDNFPKFVMAICYADEFLIMYARLAKYFSRKSRNLLSPYARIHRVELLSIEIASSSFLPFFFPSRHDSEKSFFLDRNVAFPRNPPPRRGGGYPWSVGSKLAAERSYSRFLGKHAIPSLSIRVS